MFKGLHTIQTVNKLTVYTNSSAGHGVQVLANTVNLFSVNTAIVT